MKILETVIVVAPPDTEGIYPGLEQMKKLAMETGNVVRCYFDNGPIDVDPHSPLKDLFETFQRAWGDIDTASAEKLKKELFSVRAGEQYAQRQLVEARLMIKRIEREAVADKICKFLHVDCWSGVLSAVEIIQENSTSYARQIDTLRDELTETKEFNEAMSKDTTELMNYIYLLATAVNGDNPTNADGNALIGDDDRVITGYGATAKGLIQKVAKKLEELSVLECEISEFRTCCANQHEKIRCLELDVMDLEKYRSEVINALFKGNKPIGRFRLSLTTSKIKTLMEKSRRFDAYGEKEKLFWSV